MGDRLPLETPPASRATRALTAAARVLLPNRVEAPHAYAWHEEAWEMRRTTGEVRFAEMWLGNSLSQCRLFAAYRPTPDAEPVPIESGLAVDLVQRLAGGVGGQSMLLRAFAAHLLTPGVGYLVGTPGIDSAERWGVYSSDEIRLSSETDPEFPGVQLWEIKEGEGPYEWRALPPGTHTVRVWRPDPRYSWEPDSPVRGALPILRELSLLTQHVEAMATSRLAGAGILAMDSGIQFPGGWDKWVEEFLATVTKPIRDRALAGAYAPFPVKISTNKGEKIADKLHHLMFSTPFDEHSLKLRGEALDRLATAMDMPKKTLTGESSNHWGDWHVDEQGITIHVEPNLELICEGLTRGYLRPGLAGAARLAARQDPVAEIIQLRQAPTPVKAGPEIIVWYSTEQLRAKPDTSADAEKLHDALVIGDDDWKGAVGMSEAQSPDGEKFARQVWVKMLDNPQMAGRALVELGLIEESDLPQPVAVTAPAAAPEAEAPPVPGAEPRQIPDTQDDPEPRRIAPPVPAVAATVVSAEALMAAADGLVFRALERAGNRLRSRTAGQRDASTDCTAALMHTCINTARVLDVDRLLEGAWDRLPEVAGRLGEPADALQAALDGYVRVLIRTRTPHSWDTLAVALGVDRELAA